MSIIDAQLESPYVKDALEGLAQSTKKQLSRNLVEDDYFLDDLIEKVEEILRKTIKK